MKNKNEIKAQHTPTPWTMNKKETHPWVIEAPSNIPGIPATIVKVGYRPNAAFIVRAVNMHDELVEALKIALHMSRQDVVPSHLQNDKWEQLLAKAEGK